jgi:NAD(P)-dependent dehydrogenase (short-subunit alcohol dehydrogenase family)
MKRALVIGGTSGIGLELARQFSQNHQVTITGRHDPQLDIPNIAYVELDLSESPLLPPLPSRIAQFLLHPAVSPAHTDVLIYAAGFWQPGLLDTLTPQGICTMINVGIYAPALLLSLFLPFRETKRLDGLIVITSTSQFVARRDQPVYCGTKAGVGMLAKCLSLDGRIERTLVAAPSGTDTPFWDDTGVDTSKMLDAGWVASRIIWHYEKMSRLNKYRLIKILREPARVRVVEKN